MITITIIITIVVECRESERIILPGDRCRAAASKFNLISFSIAESNALTSAMVYREAYSVLDYHFERTWQSLDNLFKSFFAGRLDGRRYGKGLEF